MMPGVPTGGGSKARICARLRFAHSHNSGYDDGVSVSSHNATIIKSAKFGRFAMDWTIEFLVKAYNDSSFLTTGVSGKIA